MNKKNLNTVAIILLALGAFGLIKGMTDLFFVFLFLSSSAFGAARMLSLMNGEIDIKTSNIRLAILGTIFGVASMFTPGILEVTFSFLFGTCFGLIGVALIHEKSK